LDENKIDPSIYRYILKHTKKDQIFILLLTLLSMPVIYVSLEIPKIIINSAISGLGIPDEFFGFEITQIDYLLLLCFLFLILVLIAGGLKYVTNVYRGIVGERMLRRFRFDLFSRILRFPNHRFKQVSQAEMLPMVTAETEPLGGFIGDAFALPAMQGGMLFTYLFFIFNQDLLLGLAAVALYPPQIYFIPKLQNKVNQLAKQRVQAVRHLSDKLGEAISGVSDIHVNDTSHYEKAHVSGRLGKIYGIRFEIYKRKFFIKFLNNFLGQLTPFFFFSIGGYFVIKGELTLGALVAVLAAYKDLASPWKELLKFYQITEDVRVKYAQVIDQFQPAKMMSLELQQDQDSDFDFSSAAISGSALSYSEDDYVNSLDGVSLSIDPGTHVAIIGPGGSGRGDLVKLIVRLTQPDSGQLKLADKNLASLSEALLGRSMSYVDQQSFVFNTSVMGNLVYGLKNRPMEDFAYPDDEMKLRQKQIADSIASGNPVDDVNANWINLVSAGFTTEQEFNVYLRDILRQTTLDQDIYQLGLFSTIDSESQPDLAARIVNARTQLREILSREENSDLVETLVDDKYNINLSVAENLFFGTPIDDDPDFATLSTHAIVEAALEKAELTDALFTVGLQTAKTLSEIFSDVPDSSPLFEKFSFVSADQLPVLTGLSRLPDDTTASDVSEDDADLLVNLSLKLTVARHRLGLITEEIQQKIVRAHLLIKEELGDENDLIEFYNEDQVANHLSIQDNILFGRISYGQANAREKVGILIDEFIAESGLKDDILSVGLEYRVGVAGARLTTIQKQKVTIARALIKNPDILVVNDAVALFDKKTAEQLTSQILAQMKNKTVIWVLGNTDQAGKFDRLIVMDKGKVLAEGPAQETLQREDIMNVFA